MSKKSNRRYITQKKKTFGLGSTYSTTQSIISDVDDDNSYEINTYTILNDEWVINCLQYINSITFSRIEFDKPEQSKIFYDLKPQFEQFLMQYLIDGISFNVETITLKNQNIINKLYYNGKWYILYKTKEYETFNTFKDIYVYIGEKKFGKELNYDKFINNDYLVVAKSPFRRYDRLLELVQLKQKIEKILGMAAERNVVNPIIITVDTIDDETKKDILSFLSNYKNYSASVLNGEIVQDIKVIDVKVNETLLFETIQKINESIASILGLSNSILMSSRQYSYSTVNAIMNIALRNINSYRKLMENKINEIAEVNNLDLHIQLPEIVIDEYRGDNDVEK